MVCFLLFTLLSQEYIIPLSKNLDVIINVFDTNQNIGIIDLGKSLLLSKKKYIKKVIAKQLIVIALKEVVITLTPIYCNTDRYKPNLTKRGIAIIGTKINNHKLSIKYGLKGSPNLKVKDNHKETVKIITSKNNVISCL